MEVVVAKVPSASSAAAVPSAMPPPPVRFYDTLMFFEELDVLRARLETVYPHVYRIVICEAGQMHCRGQPKPFHLEAAWDSFAPFHDKMVYIKLPAFPERYADFPPHLRAMKAEDAKAATAWMREYMQREPPVRWVQQEEARLAALGYGGGEAYVSVTDCDEILHYDRILERIRRDEPGGILTRRAHITLETYHASVYVHLTRGLSANVFVMPVKDVDPERIATWRFFSPEARNIAIAWRHICMHISYFLRPTRYLTKLEAIVEGYNLDHLGPEKRAKDAFETIATMKQVNPNSIYRIVVEPTPVDLPPRALAALPRLFRMTPDELKALWAQYQALPEDARLAFIRAEEARF